MNRTSFEISKAVKMALKKKQMKLEMCCEAFNVKYIEDIDSGKLKPLNKDFVSRVSRNAFKVPSERVLKLCEFLEIEQSKYEPDQLQVLSDQIREFKVHAARNSDFEKRFSSLLKFLSGLNLEKMLHGR